MDAFFFAKLDNYRTLFLTEISRRTFDEQCSDDLESDSGFFIVLEDLKLDEFQVLAKAASVGSGRALIEMLTRSSGLLVVHSTETRLN